MIQIPKCQECGACCAYAEALWIEVTKDDAVRINDDSLLQNGDIEPFAMKQLSNNRCVALSGKVGECVECNIYDKRPSICRSFERGSPECVFMLGFHQIVRPW